MKTPNNLEQTAVSIEARIVAAIYVKRSPLSILALANALYDNCMSSHRAGNGVRISNIKKVAYKSNRLSLYDGGDMVWLSPNEDQLNKDKHHE